MMRFSQILSLPRVHHDRVLTGVIASFVIPITSWLMDLSAAGLSLGLGNIVKIHTTHPSLWILDLIPVFTAIALYSFFVIWENTRRAYSREIALKDHRINKNAEFAKKIGEGDYETSFIVEDEDDILGKSLLVMRENLLVNTRKEAEQNWIAQGKYLIANILRMHNRIDILAYDVIVNLVTYIQAVQGAFYLFDEERKTLVNITTYAYNRKKFIGQEFKIGQGLIGQCAYEMDIIYRTEIPTDYVTITSGILGDTRPTSLVIVPLITDEKLQGVMEFASLKPEISEITLVYLKELGEVIARTIFNLRVNEKTERLLQESRQMTEELQENEEQLRQSAEEMRATQEELERANEELESKVREVENAQIRLHSLLENASEIISIYDETLRLTFISPSVHKILGFSPEDMMKGKDMERLTRKGEADMKDLFEQLMKQPGEPVTFQYTFLKKDGQKLFLETTGRNMLHDKAINGMVLNSSDITERKRAEKEERMKSKMQALSENSLDMILRLNTAGMFFYANPVVEDYIGIKNTEVMYKVFSDFPLPESLKTYFDDTIQNIKLAPNKLNTQITIPVRLGEKVSERIMSIDAIPEFSDNELETILFVGHDITESKRIEGEIKEKNRKIEDSINYAQRIQTSILPDDQVIGQYLESAFIFYKARDVVSGDFPWFFPKGDNIYIAAVDCTGHGVPGALLSFIGYFILNNIVDHSQEFTAGEVLDQLHYGVRSTLKQDRDDAIGRDGMDIAMCKINLKKQELQFSGAHRPLYLFRRGELQEFKGDRKAIGGIPLTDKPETDFTNYVIPIEEGDKIFFFSDGLPDQLGGPKGKKYMSARIRETIVSNPGYSMKEFHEHFEKDFFAWKGQEKQIDDVLVIGIEF